ncbi:DNA cytosine methyltransferase [Amycolatopsis sp. K13G38]|uniref:DNA (cytosine-5-)-methyltransferase n=1 Tax=Amycolatopsis acididurans TaxID=2724524 RepID=A0ABX1J5J3_9PSEU|nr:DNA cytosine methyltransferase [Amycolatopsis acididurans]NKQ53557.1 DNA cytosine methyltransferase [Amycolatopsis acididurans]
MFTLYDEFAGFGGSSQGAAAVPGVELMLAANHNPLAVEVHGMNFPDADHYCGDIAKADIASFPRADLFWASPSCPPWTDARGVRRDFDRSTQGVLFDPARGAVATDPKVARARALMEEIPRYLQAMHRKGRPVLAGVVENVVQVRKWDEFGRRRREIESHGYRARLVALNSMHVTGPATGRVAQSRDRFYMPFWLAELGRDPDWDKWLRPKAYCGHCEQVVDALQVFKKTGVDMGKYGPTTGQYVYRCPNRTCRHQLVEPEVLPASTVADWSLPPGQRIGERVDAQGRPDPLAEATLARIEAGLVRTLTTAGHQSLVGWPTGRAVVERCTFGMLATHEIAAGMGFASDYQVKGSKRDQVRGYGNAVTPPAAEVLMSALVEAVSGEDLAPAPIAATLSQPNERTSV